MRLGLHNFLAAGFMLCGSGLYGAPVSSPPAASAGTKSLLAWRTEHAKELEAPDGWLAVVGLDWLRAGDNPFGSASDNSIRIAGPVLARLGVLRVGGSGVTLLPPPGGFPAELSRNGRTAAPGKLAVEDLPDQLKAGTYSMFVIHRGDRYALRIRNSQAASRVHFHGLRWYEPRAAFRVRARWLPYTPPKQQKIATVIGTAIDATIPGHADFTLQGHRLSLEPTVEDGEHPQLFFILRDTTSRTTTYGASRFLYAAFPNHGLDQPGNLWLDFNRLENPPCAYTPYATCPLPPRQNRLAIPIPAGEKRYTK